MNESYYQSRQTHTFLRHSSLVPNRKTLLFLHGIGDSSLSYLPFLQTTKLSAFNILAPDLVGYGKSSQNNDYSFAYQTKMVVEHIRALQNQKGFVFNDIILIPHSMAGIHAMLLCESEIKQQIKGVINVEGSITQYGSFISETVSQTVKNGNFDHWFKNFKEVVIFNGLIKKFPACRAYYASLEFCQANAFLQNALEIHKVCLSSMGKYTNMAGNKFIELELPKIYCYGDQSLCKESLSFLHQNNLPVKMFKTENHFVMVQCFAEFVQFITDWDG